MYTNIEQRACDLAVFIIDNRATVRSAAKRFGISKWWLILAVACIACVCGILLLVRPSESIRVIIVLMGISLLAEGILNFSTVITAVKIVRNQQPDYIEIHEYTEKKD